MTDGVDTAEPMGSPLPAGEVDAWEAITLTAGPDAPARTRSWTC